MDLSTTYMGLKLSGPVVPSANPLVRDLDKVRQLEDAGAAAITLYSLFQEQIIHDEEELDHFLDIGKDRYAESLSDFPEEAIDHLRTKGDEYLEHLQKVKAAVGVPVIASLNGSTLGGWTEYAKRMQDAGADAIEINLYFLPTDPETTGADVETLYEDVCRAVKSSVTVPVAMKLSPYFSSMANMATRLDKAGADALVLFNRFYQPVIDIDRLDVRPNLVLSTTYESRLPMRWAAILYGKLQADMALTSGIGEGHDVAQALMAGATIANVCSAVLREGPAKIREILDDLAEWADRHGYESVEQMRGVLSQKSCPDPHAFERANYMKTLSSFK